MIELYASSGSKEIELLGPYPQFDNWERLRSSVLRLLEARKEILAVKLLSETLFDVYEGTNSFGDEFSVLYCLADLEKYVELGEQYEDRNARQAYRTIAETISEVGPFIRFVAVELDTSSGVAMVTSPSLVITSDTVERALADCEQLIHSRGATSGVDRIHTAFHGYLRAICARSAIEVSEGAGLTQLFKAIREHHSAFSDTGPRNQDILQVMNSMATILNALNPLRNKATLAHPNEAVLEEPEAMLVINSSRTLLQYLNAKLGKGIV